MDPQGNEARTYSSNATEKGRGGGLLPLELLTQGAQPDQHAFLFARLITSALNRRIPTGTCSLEALSRSENLAAEGKTCTALIQYFGMSLMEGSDSSYDVALG